MRGLHPLCSLIILYMAQLSQGKVCSLNVGNHNKNSPIYLQSIKDDFIEVKPNEGFVYLQPSIKYVVQCPPNTHIDINGTATNEVAFMLYCMDDPANEEEIITVRFACLSNNHLSSIENHQISKRGAPLILPLVIHLGRLLALAIKGGVVVAAKSGAAVAVAHPVATGVGVGTGAAVIGIIAKAAADAEAKAKAKKKQNLPCPLRMAPASPLVLDEVAGILDYVYPTMQLITMMPGQTYYVTCGEDEVSGHGVTHGELLCVSGDDIKFRGREEVWTNIKCSSGLAESIVKNRHWTTNCNGGNQQSIGWNYGRRFVPQIDICYKQEKYNPIYTKHTLKKTNFFPRFNGGGRPPFLPEFGVMAEAYRNFDVRLRTVYGIRGEQISRGHLSPNSDFVYPCQRAATFYYINMLPQWKEINSGDWELMEGLIQRSTSATDYIVYTGGHSNEISPNSLRISMLDGGSAPVPKYLWKLVYNPVAKHAIGFIGLNSLDAGQSNIILRQFGCAGICRRTNWNLPDNRNNEGLVFCCPYETLSEHIPFVRNLALDVQGKLHFN